MESNNIEENGAQKKYKGIRRRKWGKWVSEIRVPGSQNNRLWLGSYRSPEAAAVAHDVAFYCLRRPLSIEDLNFPSMLPASVHAEMSPRSVQKAASDAGMAVDAQVILNENKNGRENEVSENENGVMQVLDGKHFWEDDDDDESFEFKNFGKSEEKELNISIEDYLNK